MDIYLLKAFDVANFNLFTPSPAGFTTEEAAKVFCDGYNALKGDLYYAYDKVTLSEMPAEELKKAIEESAT